jgi:Mg/Co/Ni transporter MgtE
MTEELRILTPQGMLGYGVPAEHFWRGIESGVDAMVVDSGSTDPGPYMLGLGHTLVPRESYTRDVSLMLKAAYERKIPLIISSGGNSGSQATSILIRSLALQQVRLGDWWRVFSKELLSSFALGVFLGAIGFVRICMWYWFGWQTYENHPYLMAMTVWGSLIGVVMFGSLVGSMLPFLLRKLGFDPATASAPFVATLVDVTGLIIYFTVASIFLHGTLL